MEKEYTSKYGKIIKRCPGLPEYWHKGKLIARGGSLTGSDPRVRPTSDDWKYCTSLRKS